MCKLFGHKWEYIHVEINGEPRPARRCRRCGQLEIRGPVNADYRWGAVLKGGE